MFCVDYVSDVFFFIKDIIIFSCKHRYLLFHITPYPFTDKKKKDPYVALSFSPLLARLLDSSGRL